MLRLPAAVLEDISLRAGQVDALSQTCSTIWRLLNQPETQLRFYLEAQRRRRRSSCGGNSSSGGGNGGGGRCVSSSGGGSSYRPCQLLLALPAAAPAGAAAQRREDDHHDDPKGPASEPDEGFSPATVFNLLCCKARATDAPSSMRLLQLLLGCANMVALVPPGHAQAAVQHMVAASDPAAAPEAAALLLSVLPYAEHCLLPFAAAAGQTDLVRLLLPHSAAPARLHAGLHYVKTSAFLSAAARGQCGVLSELLRCGATSWACQLPGASITQSALDLAALGGHIQAMQLLGHYVANPSPLFLTAAADSGSGGAMEWALQAWFGQFSAVTAYSRAHMMQLHDALRVSCQRGHVSAVRQLLAALHATHSPDCAIVALGYASSTCNTEALRAVLDSPQLAAQLARGGPKLVTKLAQALASCLRIALLRANAPALELLLSALTREGSPAAAARPLMAPQMPSVFDQAAAAGHTAGLQLLLLALPEHWEGLGPSALEAALSEGHAEAAAAVKTLLIMRGPDANAAAAALTPEGSPGLARASLAGAYKGACVRGDEQALGALLQAGPSGPDDNSQLLLLRLAAGAGRLGAVRLLLAEFGGGGPRLEANLRAVCRGAVHAGQLRLLKALASDSPSPLLAHIASQPEALAEYLRAALLCGQVDVAAWLVLLAAERQQLDLVRHTLISLLATPRWELLNAGRGISAQDVVFQLLRQLAAEAAAAAAAASSKAGTGQAQAQAAAPHPPTGSAAAAGAGAGAADAGAGAGSSAAPGAPRAGAAGAPAGAAQSTVARPEAAAAAAEPLAAAPGAGAGALQDAVDPAPPATAAAGAAPAGSSSSSSSSTSLCALGAHLLQPPLLGLLLHATQGDPWRLLDVGEVLQAFGLYEHPGHQQQQQQDQVAGNTAAAAAVAGGQPGAVRGGEGCRGRRTRGGRGGSRGAITLLPNGSPATSAGTSSSGGLLPPSARGSASTLSPSSSSSSSSSGGSRGGGGARTPRSGPATDSADGGPGGPGDLLLLAGSLESGSNGSEEYPHAAAGAAGTWLGDLVTDAGGCCGVNGLLHSSAGGGNYGSAFDQLLQLHPYGQQQQFYFGGPLSPVQSHQQQQQRAETPGQLNQLTGRVAQLNMSAAPSPGPSSRQQQEHHQQEHQQQQQQPRQQQQQRVQLARHSIDLPAVRHRRGSSPGRGVVGAGGEARMRRPTSSTPLTSQQLHSTSPVHPYMQQCTRLQLHTQPVGQQGKAAPAAPAPAPAGEDGSD